MYSDHETYFNYEINVYNGPYLPYGVHNFPFSFTLPYNLPSSFESKDGQVRYEVRGKNLTRRKIITQVRLQAEQVLKTVAFITGEKKIQQSKIFFIHFSIENLIANISFYALRWPKLNFGCYLTFEIIF